MTSEEVRVTNSVEAVMLSSTIILGILGLVVAACAHGASIKAAKVAGTIIQTELYNRR